MENKKQELLERIEQLRNDLDEVLDNLRPTWEMSDELEDILNECVDDLEMGTDLYEKLDNFEKLVQNTNDMDELDTIEYELYDIDFALDTIEIDSDLVLEKINDYFIYYSDAWEYLGNRNITDFEEAFNEGYTGICEIASYYLWEEYMRG